MGMSSGGGSGLGSRATLSEINVTPLVDVMLVLLIMFMVTTPLMQQGIEVDLPKTAASGVEPKTEPFVVVINARKQISAGKQSVPFAQFREKMQAISKMQKDRQVYIQADKSVDYGFVVEVMAELRAAGIYNIGLITLPKDKQ